MAGGTTGAFASLNPSLFHRQPNNNNGSAPRKPKWVIKTESNVNREVRSKPDRPCVVCGGCGKIFCRHCRGRGRTNSVHLAMLPKGEWPQWCRTCGGSGLDYCMRCKGTGEYKKPFLFDDDDPPPTNMTANSGDSSSGNSSSPIS